MTMPVTTFKYLDNVRDSWRTDEPQICVICAQPRAVFPFVTFNEEDESYERHHVCDECLVAGRLAERSLQVNDGDLSGLLLQIKAMRPDLSDDERAALAADRTAEVEQRTPRPEYSNLFVWPFHCGDYAVFFHKTNAAEMDELAPDNNGRAFLAAHLHDDAASMDPEALTDSWENRLNGFWEFYLWRCRQCGKYLITYTCE